MKFAGSNQRGSFQKQFRCCMFNAASELFYLRTSFFLQELNDPVYHTWRKEIAEALTPARTRSSTVPKRAGCPSGRRRERATVGLKSAEADSRPGHRDASLLKSRKNILPAQIHRCDCLDLFRRHRTLDGSELRAYLLHHGRVGPRAGRAKTAGWSCRTFRLLQRLP